MRRSLLSLVLAWGCSCGSASTGAPAPTPRPSAAASEAGSYTVHEWGLVRAGAGDTLEVGAMGPTAPPPAMMIVEKPVLYFHLAGSDAIDVRVTVDARDGEIREHWPRTETASPIHSVTWPSVRVHEGGACPMPTVGACPALDPGEPCETAELARAVATDASCVAVGSEEAPFVFYRVRTRALTVPLVARATAGGDLEIRNDGELAIPGRVVRFQRQMGRVRVVVADPPAPHASTTIGHDWDAPDAARTAVRASLADLGLTPGEAEAFLASWDGAFFGIEASERAHAASEDIVEEIPPPETSLLYFLPEADADRLAHVEITPPPTELRRAMAVWTAL